MTRRRFLAGLSALPIVAARASQSSHPQRFPIGYSPEFGFYPTVEKFWAACADCHRLGFHNVETDTEIAEYYSSRIAELKSKLTTQNVRLMAFYPVLPMLESGQRSQAIELALKVGRVLQATGGKYMSLIIGIHREPHQTREDVFRAMTREHFQCWSQSAAEVGKRLQDETGIRIGFHPERREIRAGVVDRLLEMADPRYMHFVPDTGHYTAAGVDPLEIYKKYRSRMIATHLKDWDPNLSWKRNEGNEKGRAVPLGRGIVDFPSLIAFLKETEYSEPAMVELDGEPSPSQEMKDYLRNKLSLSLDVV